MWVPTKDEIWATHAINTEPETVRFLGHAHSRHDHFQRFSRNAGSWLLYGYGGFMVRERGSGRLLGNCGIFHSYRGLGEDFDDFPEAGWILRSDSVGQGFGMEAMGAVLPWFERENGPQRIVCMITLGNEPSIKLAGKLGFLKRIDQQFQPAQRNARCHQQVPGVEGHSLAGVQQRDLAAVVQCRLQAGGVDHAD